jgi:photosynthetic reaction center H subunit
MPANHVQLVGGLDIAELAFYLFAGFFLMLVLYLRREDRREGYPLEHEFTGVLEGDSRSPIQWAKPKTFKMPFGRAPVTMPGGPRDRRDLKARWVDRFPGSAIEPVGDPFTAGVGPGSWVARTDEPDLTMSGEARITPLSVNPGVHVAKGDTDPRGLPVMGCDGNLAGHVTEIWMDRADALIRYLQVDTGQRVVLVPMTCANVRRNKVQVDAITAAQFAGIPGIKAADRITKLEEEKVVAYFGAGYLYATPGRQEPIL